VVKGNPKWLKSMIMPYNNLDENEFEDALGELMELNRIFKFTHNNESYFYIPKFNVYQRIDKPSIQRNPAPPEQLVKHSENTQRIIPDETETEVKQKQK